jgi:uncharacterized protein YndB with AHSA1/START domain/uncharacterized damage-inducible protein DinB
MTKERVVRVSQEVDATPETVFRALTHPLELSFWLCHQAWTEPRVGGDFLVRWRNGWWARGVYQTVERPRRVALTWQGKDEPGETTVTFEIEALDKVAATAVTVVHSGYGEEAIWDKAVAEAEKSWPLALENLASILATGVDLREARRPLLGIMPGELTPERAAREGIATESGVYLAGVTEDGGAAKAGLQKGDAITRIGGMAVPDMNALTTTLSPYRAGDRVQVGYVRGRDHGTVVIELKARPMPEVSFDPRQVVAQVREEQATLMDELRQAVTGLSEEEAGKKPSDGEWSVKETLAHLSVSERLLQRELADLIVGTTAGQYGGNPTVVAECLAMTLAAAPTVEALLARFEQDMEETRALFAALRPEVVAMKARYRAMANMMQFWLFHTREHLHQIKATLGALRG